MAAPLLRRARNAAVKTVAAGTLLVGTVEVTTHLPSEGRSSKFYHSVSDKVVTPMMRRLLQPEQAHDLALEFARRGWAPTWRPSPKEYLVQTKSAPFACNLEFDNCIGLAAGFDKDGTAVLPLLQMGFGFVEIGSVTPEPQPGNPKPRMFRVGNSGIINRYGFNSAGVDVVQQNLELFRHPPPPKEEPKHPVIETMNRLIQGTIALFRPVREERTPGVVGVNLGKNKESEDEIADYERGICQLGPLADYLVINVSSPNTPGLRDLQHPDPLKRLLNAAVVARNDLPLRSRMGKPYSPPLLVKLAPDLEGHELEEICKAVMETGVDGIVVSNTTLSRPNVTSTESGGLSGAPVRDMSTECIRKVFEYTNGTIPIIGVGGVGSGEDAYEKLKAGASLIQIYSMMVYHGPGLVSRIREELAETMLQNGQRRIQDVVGLDHEEIYWKKREEKLLRLEQKTVMVDSTASVDFEQQPQEPMIDAVSSELE